jgi:thioesterase domain-containing protein
VGGVVAFETARQLNAARGLPISLFLVEPSPPGKAASSGLRQLAYFYKKAKDLYKRWIKGSEKRRQFKRMLKQGLPIPLALSWWYYEPLYTRAIRAFEPKPFAGRLTLVIGAQATSPAIDHWRAFVVTTRRLHSVVAESHLALVEDPNCIRQWLPLLQQHLHNGQALPVETNGEPGADRQNLDCVDAAR